MLDECQLFSENYAVARERFLQAGRQIQWQSESHPIAERGPNQEELAIDVLISPGDQKDALVLTTGVHGVEGLVGSAVLMDALQRWQEDRRAAERVRIVLVHAVNPYGFAWRRRWNENNVDLNRNFLLDGERFEGCSEGYRKINPLLNPQTPPIRFEPVTLGIVISILRYGMPALKEAVATGQYEFPKGVFFGGHEPSQSNRIFEKRLPSWLGSAERVMHLDFHTGLGRWSKYKLLLDSPLTEVQRKHLNEWFGAGRYEEYLELNSRESGKTGYPIRGSIGRWCASKSGGRDYLYAAAEFGTFGPVRMTKGMRLENQLHHWGNDPVALDRAREHLVELFCPRSELWRTRVVQQSREMIESALRGLGNGG